MIRVTIVASFLFCLQMVLSAQDIIPCGDIINKELLSAKYEGYAELVEHTYNEALAREVDFRDGDTLTIPIVFHVVYNTPQQNISDGLIQNQLDVLNEDFLRINEDAAMTRDIFLDVAGTPNIQFALANVDPDGNTTSGVTRTQTSVESFADIDFNLILEAFAACGLDPECIAEYLGGSGLDLDLMKSEETGGVDPWDVDSYLNIWICNLSADLGGGPTPFILGFAYPPVGAPNWPTADLPDNYWENDGVVIHWEAFGRNNPNAGILAGTNDHGRTCTHEVGHYLGLRHIWGDGDCAADDGLLDTPNAGSNSQSEDINNAPTCDDLHQKDSCLDDMLPDMIENYMDYSIESCQNMFTVEQSNLMRAMLEGPRSGLLSGLADIEQMNIESSIVISTLISTTLNILGMVGRNDVYLFDISGNLIVKRSMTNEGIIEMQHLSSGQYIVKIVKDGKIVIVNRVVKH